MLNSGWSRLVPNVGRVTMGKKVALMGVVPAPKQSHWVVQEGHGGGVWFDLIPPVAASGLAYEVLEEFKRHGKINLRVKEVP